MSCTWNRIDWMFRVLLAAIAWAAGSAVFASPQEIVFIAPSNHTMPFVDIQRDKLMGGILMDVGEAIAARLNRTARFLVLPSKRIVPALNSAQADGLCYVAPGWIEGDHNWTKPIFHNQSEVIARLDQPKIVSLSELENVPVGTIFTYHYPDFEEILGSRFKRIDAMSMELNLRMLEARRMDFAIVEQITLDYLKKTNRWIDLHEVYRGPRYGAMCAFSKKSSIPFQEVQDAINKLEQDGTMAEILARYR